MESLAALEARLARLVAAQEELDRRIAQTMDVLAQLKRKELRVGSFAPLVEALDYHHQMTNGWTYLAEKGRNMALTPENWECLFTEFMHMRDVVIHYEYVVQRALGINPAPGIGLYDIKGRDGQERD